MMGTAWYPEQWPESRWDADLTLMQQAGIHMVRIGEFSWSRMEPSEGHYDLDWLDRAVTAAAKHGIYSVIGTPTAAPPAWLTQRYPDTLRVDEEGHGAEHGNRQQFNFANGKYRELARKIAEQLARRFGHNPYVLGWQIDNEYSDISFDPDTKAQFRQWLKTRYGTLDNLNARWTTSYCSETIFAWDQIPIQTQYGNPGLLLSWKRFVSDTWRSYQKNQLDVIRANSDPQQFITTNTMGWYDGFDHYVVEKDLDLAAWDDYVGQGHLDPAKNGFAHDLTRGFKGKNFWVMETQPGSVNWAPINNSLDKRGPRDGLARGRTRRRCRELLAMAQRAEWPGGIPRNAAGSGRNTRTLVCGSAADWPGICQGRSGARGNVDQIRSSYDSRWAIDWQRHNKNYDPIDELVSYYGPLRAVSQSVDVVEPVAPLSQYKLVVAPGLNVLSDAAAKTSYRLRSPGWTPGVGPAFCDER
jgi:beta-galactosidase